MNNNKKKKSETKQNNFFERLQAPVSSLVGSLQEMFAYEKAEEKRRFCPSTYPERQVGGDSRTVFEIAS